MKAYNCWRSESAIWKWFSGSEKWQIFYNRSYYGKS